VHWWSVGEKPLISTQVQKMMHQSDKQAIFCQTFSSCRDQKQNFVDDAIT
jgi:hypothetical protein